MFVFSLISLAFGPDFAEVDYSFQVGAAIKPPTAITATIAALPSTQAHTDASNLRIATATHHRDAMGFAFRQPLGSWPPRMALNGGGASRVTSFKPVNFHDWSPNGRVMGLATRQPQLFRFAAPITTMDCCLRPHPMGFQFAAVSGGGGFTRSAGLQFAAPHAMGIQFGTRTVMSGPWPERGTAAVVRTLDATNGLHIRH